MSAQDNSICCNGSRQLPLHAPQLAWLGIRLVRLFSSSLASLCRRRWRPRMVDTRIACRGDIIHSVEEQTCRFDFACGSAGQTPVPELIVEFTPAAAFGLLAGMLGARQPETLVPRRALTGVERNMLCRLAQAAARDVSRSWPGDASPIFRPRELREMVEAAPVPGGGADDDGMLLATFELSSGPSSGQMRLAMSMSLLGQIPLPAGAVRRGPLEVTACIEEPAVGLCEQQELRPGDILVTEVPLEGDIVIRVAGIPKYVGRLANCNGKRAITITGKI